MGRSRRLVFGWALGIIGLVQLAGIVAYDALGRASTGQELLDDARPTVGREGLLELRQQLDQLGLVFDQTIAQVFPTLAADVGLTPAEFVRVVRRDYPAIAVMLDRVDEISGAFQKTVENLEAHQDDFEAADDLPVPGAPMIVMPWAMVGLALGLAGAGVASVLRRASRWPVLTVAVIGGALVVMLLVFQIPQKSAQAEDLLDSLNGTEASAVKTREQFEVTAAFVAELSDAFLPELARARGLTAEQFVAELGPRFPELVAALPAVQPALDRLELDVAFREEHYADIADVQSVPLAAMGWGALGLGALVAVAAGWMLVSERRRPEAPGGGHRGSSVRGRSF